MTKAQDVLFRTLADPTRRAIFERLCREGEKTVGALTARAGVSQPVVSKHLGVLKQAGLVRGRHEGRETHYSAQVRALDFDSSDVVLFFRGVPHIVPVRLANEEARRVAAEFGAALVPYAVPGTPAVLAPVSQFFLPKDHRAVGKVCPRCKSNDFEETAPPKWLRVAPRRCKACGTDYDPPTPIWKQVARATLDPRSWFGFGGWG